MEATDAKKSSGSSGPQTQPSYRLRRLLGAVAGMVVSLTLAALIARSELYAVPGGVAFAARHEIATAIRSKIGRIERHFDNP